ncbi:MAG TPA: YihY/virulence factor BrkB family protein [Isosphaeraceae bacterium]|jgi:membrane protein
MSPKTVWHLLEQAGSEWLEDKAPRLGAALAYYTLFAIAPVLIIAIAIGGLVFKREAVQGQILGQVRGLVGEQGGQAIQSMIVNAGEAGYTATGIGAVLLLIGAIGLFGQLQDALDTIWEVRPKPGRGLWGFLKDRLLSLTMVLGTAFLLLVSLVVSTALAALISLLGAWQVGFMGLVFNNLVSLIVITPLFAMIYRYLPDAEIAWGDVWLGASLTTVLFLLGKAMIGVYIGHGAIGSMFGAAGSLVLLLIWAYYAAQTFLFGAELTKAYANRFGSRIIPEADAEAITEEARREQGIPRTEGHSPAESR